MALLRAKEIADFTDGAPEGVDGPDGAGSQKGLQLCERKTVMIIGNFTYNEARNTYTGELATLSVAARKVVFQPNEAKTDKAPSYRVIGPSETALWHYSRNAGCGRGIPLHPHKLAGIAGHDDAAREITRGDLFAAG